ncbi:hypothetical protein [Brevibacillus brevis]|uniref:hypothetical protein n=1 Tax=Brevibacillus brevis TaxID=1393 RepID=UPI000D0FC2A2|nr:hypothetical protein [Brevibacillus brevis]PSJ69849.1 hypothetical protein C7J99_07445 [Brevibacillus brevis]RED21454.1 hypothetical protein DES34_12034 [Brevibacillus brevis]GEC91787.1 hypothetical protein BBR01nite_41180 [Brevibacillus brevis]VEF87326.1 Uncharacterised protein [Brevibacillus brevis]
MKKVVAGFLSLTLLASLSISATTTEVEAKSSEIKKTAGSIYYDYEPNNSREAANPYSIGGQINGNIEDSKFDYYKFTAEKSGTIRVQFAYARGDINSSKYQDFWLEIVQNTGPSGVRADYYHHSFDKQVVAGETYYLRAARASYDSSMSNAYSIYTYYVN